MLRTTKGKQVPVYTDFKAGRTKVLTIVRRITGDAEALRDELQRVLAQGSQPGAKPPAVRAALGRVEVDGNWAAQTRQWLLRLGF